LQAGSWVMTIRDMFFTRPPPPPVLSAVQRLDWFLNSIREKNSLVVTGKLEAFDELYRSEKPPEAGRTNTVDNGAMLDGPKHSYEEITATTRLNHKVKVAPDVIADAESLPLRELDFIIASHVLEHLPSPLRALRSWYGALRSCGFLLLKVPDNDSPSE
jgi:SAM-dependent methyltransferase